MDSQDKIRLNFPYINLQKDINISSFGVHNFPFEIYESDDVEVTNITKDTIIAFEIEGSKTQGNYKELNYNESFILNDHKEPKCAMPYKIIVYDSNHNFKYQSLYNILPLHAVGHEPYLAIINYVKKINSNLIFDKSQSKNIEEVVNKTANENSDDIIIEKLHKNSNQLLYLLKDLFANSHDEKFNKKLEKNKQGNINSYKAIIKNALNMSNGNTTYSVSNVLDNDYRNDELLFAMLTCVTEPLSRLINYQESKVERLNIIVKSLEPLGVESLPYIAKLNELDKSNQELKTVNLLDKICNNNIRKGREIFKFKFKGFNPTKSFLSSKTNNFLYINFYKLLNLKKRNEIKSYQEVIGNPYFPTYKIFELYVLLKLHRMILDLGFKDINPIPLEQLTNLGLDQGFEFAYFKDGLSLILDYTMTVEKLDAALEMSREFNAGMYSINSNKNTPDFVLTLLDENEKLLYSAVIDAKCRPFDKIRNFIYDVDDHNNVNKGNMTLRDYLSFRYIEKGGNAINSKGIDDLIFVCPEQDKVQQIKDPYFGAVFSTTSCFNELDNFISYLLVKLAGKI